MRRFCVLLLWSVASASASNQRTVTIAPGVEMPLLNFGVSNRSLFIELGGRGLDTAWVYGDLDQAETGEAVRSSSLQRSELFVTTKIPCCPSSFITCNKSMGHEYADKQIQHDFDILGLDYVDLMLMHWPCENFEDTLFVYQRMEALLKKKKARAIGVSNFNATLLQALDSKVSVKPVVNQVGFSVAGHASHETPWGRDDVSHAKAKELGITTMAYSPLGGVTRVDVLHNPDVLAVAAAHNRSAAQVALRWLVQQGIAPVTSSNSAHHDVGDLQVFDFELTDAEVSRLALVSQDNQIIV